MAVRRCNKQSVTSSFEKSLHRCIKQRCVLVNKLINLSQYLIVNLQDHMNNITLDHPLPLSLEFEKAAASSENISIVHFQLLLTICFILFEVHKNCKYLLLIRARSSFPLALRWLQATINACFACF